MAAGMTGAMGTLIANANLIKKVYFPREILVVANVLASTVSLLIELAVLAVALMLFGNIVLPWLPMVIVLVALQTLFVIGVGLLMSVLNVYFRDVQHFVEHPAAAVVLRHADHLPALPRAATPRFHGHRIPLKFIYQLNPMVGFVEAIRDCLYDLRFPPVGELAYLVVVSLRHPGPRRRRVHQARAQAGRGAVTAPPPDRSAGVRGAGGRRRGRLQDASGSTTSATSR